MTCTCTHREGVEARAAAVSEVVVHIVGPEHEARFQQFMQHYLGALPKIGQTLWYVAHRQGTWLALAVFSAAALKCGARDRWVGWDFRRQYGRLHLVANSTRLLVLPGPRVRNLGSRVPGRCARRIVRHHRAERDLRELHRVPGAQSPLCEDSYRNSGRKSTRHRFRLEIQQRQSEQKSILDTSRC